MRKIILIIALLVFPLVCFSQDAATEATLKYEGGLSKEQIIEAAKSKAEDLGFNLEEMIIVYDEGNQQFKEYLKPREVDIGSTPGGRYSWLVGIDYQAVYLANQDLKKGGILWIFIDRATGKVITHTIEDSSISLKVEGEEQPQYLICY